MSLSPRLEEKVNDLYNRLHEAVEHPDLLSTHDQFFLIGSAMALAEEMPDLKGWEKKLIVEAVLNLLVRDITRKMNNPIISQIMTPEVISTIIELIVAASKGEFHLNEKCKSFRKFICCLK